MTKHRWLRIDADIDEIHRRYNYVTDTLYALIAQFGDAIDDLADELDEVQRARQASRQQLSLPLLERPKY